MRVTIRAVGKPRPAELASLIREYERRASARLELHTQWVRSSRELWTGATGHVTVLDPRGWAPTSEELAAHIDGVRGRGLRTMYFLIGDADGFDDSDRKRADQVISLSRLTLPHRLAMLLTVEQLYRAGTILDGHPYHRE